MMTDPFVIGDPVTAKTAPNILGRLVDIRNYSGNFPETSTAASTLFVKLIGRGAVLSYFPDELEICRCAARIPKGVTKCAV